MFVDSNVMITIHFKLIVKKQILIAMNNYHMYEALKLQYILNESKFGTLEFGPV